MRQLGPLLGPTPLASEYLEAYRALRAAVLSLQKEEAPQAILVTSATPGEGKTTVSVNLATVMALAEKKTLLVDGDFRRPELHLLFELPEGPGLTDVCVGAARLEQAIRRTYLPHLFVLTAGSRIEEGADLMGSARMNQLMVELKQEFEFSIIDSAPVNAFAGALQIAVMVDVVLFVVRSRTYAGPVQRALRALESVGANVPGIVLNDVMEADREVSMSYSYYRGYEEEGSGS